MNFKLTLLLTFAFVAAAASAQGRGPGGGGRGGPFGMPPGGGGGRGPGPAPAPVPSPDASRSHRNVPVGRWWDDSGFARSIGIDGRQQRHLDDIFESNKPTLVQLYQNLQTQQSQLDGLRAHNADESQLFQQIDRVSQARGDLQKAYAHLLLQIRKELTPEQAAKLDQLQPS